jgi:hypothetical protein
MPGALENDEAAPEDNAKFNALIRELMEDTPFGLSSEFRVTWQGLPEADQNEIDDEAKDYRDYWAYQDSQLRALRLPSAPVYAESIGNLIETLSQNPKIRSNPAYAKTQIERITALIRTAWGIQVEAHAPLQKEEQHRYWSKMIDQGKSYKELADEANVDPEHVRTSVRRHRKRREKDQWLLRAAIYRRRQAGT